MALFSSPHLLLRCKRPCLRSAGKEGYRFNWVVALQITTRAAAYVRGSFIRKMRPFEESHTSHLVTCSMSPSCRLSAVLLAGYAMSRLIFSDNWSFIINDSLLSLFRILASVFCLLNSDS
jgi:hypothetical protein